MVKTFCPAGNFNWVIGFFLFITMGCQKSIEKDSISENVLPNNDVASNARHHPKGLKDFKQVNLVSDNPAYNPVLIDPNLVNGWGLAFAPSGPAWVSAEATGLGVIYNKDGEIVRPPVAIPRHRSGSGGHPTGIVFNGTPDFLLPNGNPARFIFAQLDGIISGWNTGGNAIKMVDESISSVFTGIALASDKGANFLYAANFLTGTIQVFDKDFIPDITKLFIDKHLPPGYSPFNIQNIDGYLYVMYAKVGVSGKEEAGPGKGYVNIFSPNGKLKKRLVSRGQLNAPWGIAKAPEGFFRGDENDDNDDDDDDGNHRYGKKDFDDVILIGNAGDGRINAFNNHGHFLGQLRKHGNPIIIDGLKGISFAPRSATGVDPDWLFFAAGPNDGQNGLFGYIKK